MWITPNTKENELQKRLLLPFVKQAITTLDTCNGVTFTQLINYVAEKSEGGLLLCPADSLCYKVDCDTGRLKSVILRTLNQGIFSGQIVKSDRYRYSLNCAATDDIKPTGICGTCGGKKKKMRRKSCPMKRRRRRRSRSCRRRRRRLSCGMGKRCKDDIRTSVKKNEQVEKTCEEDNSKSQNPGT